MEISYALFLFIGSVKNIVVFFFILSKNDCEKMYLNERGEKLKNP
jgi:hypothetical protein